VFGINTSRYKFLITTIIYKENVCERENIQLLAHEKQKTKLHIQLIAVVGCIIFFFLLQVVSRGLYFGFQICTVPIGKLKLSYELSL
jgi:hypothetical protein